MLEVYVMCDMIHRWENCVIKDACVLIECSGDSWIIRVRSNREAYSLETLPETIAGSYS